ncbi:MAG: hypothetical protein ACLR8L_16185 [Oscillospiraceae bacterium]
MRNEWSRFLALIESGEQKVLIPAYRDMSPYDLPEEFRTLQALDMSRLGFMQDLIRGIKKFSAQKPLQVRQIPHLPYAPRVLFLENREWKNAESYCEAHSRSGTGKRARRMSASSWQSCRPATRPTCESHAAALAKNNTYRLALRYADAALKAELESYAQQQEDNYSKTEAQHRPPSTIRTWINRIRRNPLPLFLIAAVLCIALIVYSNGACRPSKKLNRAMALIDAGGMIRHTRWLESLGKDELIADSRYQRAVALSPRREISQRR